MIDLKFLEYGENRVPFFIGYYALRRFKQETGIDFDSVTDQFEKLEVLFYHGVIAGYKHQKTPEEQWLTRDEIEVVLDANMIEFTDLLADFFQAPKKQKTGAQASKRKKSKSSMKPTESVKEQLKK